MILKFENLSELQTGVAEPQPRFPSKFVLACNVLQRGMGRGHLWVFACVIGSGLGGAELSYAGPHREPIVLPHNGPNVPYDQYAKTSCSPQKLRGNSCRTMYNFDQALYAQERKINSPENHVPMSDVWATQIKKAYRSARTAIIQGAPNKEVREILRNSAQAVHEIRSTVIELLEFWDNEGLGSVPQKVLFDDNDAPSLPSKRTPKPAVHHHK